MYTVSNFASSDPFFMSSVVVYEVRFRSAGGMYVVCTYLVREESQWNQKLKKKYRWHTATTTNSKSQTVMSRYRHFVYGLSCLSLQNLRLLQSCRLRQDVNDAASNSIKQKHHRKHRGWIILSRLFAKPTLFSIQRSYWKDLFAVLLVNDHRRYGIT